MGDNEQLPVFDPGPTDYELRMLDKMSTEELQPSDLSNPAGVQFLIYQQKRTLVQLRDTEKQLSDLGIDYNTLRDEKENLRIELTKAQSRGTNTLFEIPISVLIGYALTMLDSTDLTIYRIGWVLFLLSLVMLSFLRGDLIVWLFSQIISKAQKGGDNARH